MSLRIALFGQADFGKQCLDRLIADGHRIVGVFAPPAGGRPDALAARAEEPAGTVDRALDLRRPHPGRFRARRLVDPGLRVPRGRPQPDSRGLRRRASPPGPLPLGRVGVAGGVARDPRLPCEGAAPAPLEHVPKPRCLISDDSGRRTVRVCWRRKCIRSS